MRKRPFNEFIAYDPNMYMGFDTSGKSASTNPAGTIDNKTGHREVSLAAKFYFQSDEISTGHR